MRRLTNFRVASVPSPVGGALGLCLLLALGGAQDAAAQWPPAREGDTVVAVPESLTQIHLSFAPLVAAARPAVVNVYASLEDSTSLGSGVIVSPDGVVVTNYHVIAGGLELWVVLSDRREVPAELVGADPDADLAVLRVDLPDEKLAYLEMADPEKAQVGDLVLAIGNPRGLGQSVSSGIISALEQTRAGLSEFHFFIQTDASINPGNSGGALIDMSGRLLGINTEIYSESGGSEGLGFAIPSTMVDAVVASVLEHGAVLRPWLGAATDDVNTAMAEAIGLERPYGALVTDVSPASPGARAGIQVGDVLLSIDGYELLNGSELEFRLATYKADDKIEIVIMRDGRFVELSVVLTLPPSAALAGLAVELTGRHPLDGASVVALTPELMNEYGLGQMRGGALVTVVEPGSPATNIGLQPGDVIVGVNGREISNTENLLDQLSTPQTMWRISFVHEGEIRSVSVRG